MSFSCSLIVSMLALCGGVARAFEPIAPTGDSETPWFVLLRPVIHNAPGTGCLFVVW